MKAAQPAAPIQCRVTQLINVRFTPESIAAAQTDVRFVPQADIAL
jgi:hypothetical protein